MNKRLQLVIVLGLMVLILGLIVLNQDRLMSMLRKTSGDADLKEEFNIPITREQTSDMENVAFGTAMYFTEQGRLKAVSFDNQPLWDIPMAELVTLEAKNDRLLVVDEAVGNVYLLDEAGGLIASLLGLGPIDSTQLLDSNQVVIVPKSSQELRVYDATLKLQSTLAIPSGKVLGFHVSLEYDRMAVLTLEDADGALRTSVVLYNLKGGALQVINRDEIAIAAYTYRDEIFVVIPTGVVVYKEMLRRPVQYDELSAVKSTHLYQDKLYLETGSLDPTKAQGELSLVTYDFKDRKVIFDNKLTSNYDKIVTQGNQILMIDKNNLTIRTSGGDEVLAKTYPVPIRKAAIMPDGQVVLVFSDRISLNLLTH